MGPRKVSGVVLAAGPSRRFGDRPPKQLVTIDGEPLARRIAGRAVRSKLSEVLMVVGKAADVVERSCRDLEIRFVRNPDFEKGQSLSVRLGLQAIDPEAAAVMFIPVDQPELSTRLMDSLIDCYLRTSAPIVVPTYRGQRGAPVLFDRQLFAELTGIEGDAGGRQLFPRHESEIIELPLASGEPLRDLDTPADLRKSDLR